MTGETIRDLLQPLVGNSGSISLVVSRTGHIGFVTTENEKLTDVEVRPDGLVRVERETGWAVVDPGEVVAVVWDSEPKASAGQFL
jgi:uncharacterized protein YaiE (UPF0345 family)